MTKDTVARLRYHFSEILKLLGSMEGDDDAHKDDATYGQELARQVMGRRGIRSDEGGQS